jgi:hypothetical protein
MFFRIWWCLSWLLKSHQNPNFDGLYNSPPLVSVLNHMNPIQTLAPSFFNACLNFTPIYVCVFQEVSLQQIFRIIFSRLPILHIFKCSLVQMFEIT